MQLIFGDLGGKLKNIYPLEPNGRDLFLSLCLKNICFASFRYLSCITDLNLGETIFGVAWEYDASHNTSTTFNFGDYSKMTSADIGNYHFGYVGRFTNNGKGFNESTLWIAAGLVEIKKNILNEGRIFLGLNRMTQLFGLGAPRPPFGDLGEDFIWSTSGMIDADKFKNR